MDNFDLQVYYEQKILPLIRKKEEVGFEKMTEDERDMLGEYSDMHKDEFGFRPVLGDDEDLCYQVYQRELEQAKKCISDYNAGEFDSDETDFSDLSDIAIGYTTTEDDKKEIFIRIDLINNRMSYKLNDEVVKSDDYSCLKEFLEFDLQYLGGMDNCFSTHVSEVQAIYDKRNESREHFFGE